MDKGRDDLGRNLLHQSCYVETREGLETTFLGDVAKTATIFRRGFINISMNFFHQTYTYIQIKKRAWKSLDLTSRLHTRNPIVPPPFFCAPVANAIGRALGKPSCGSRGQEFAR